MEDSILCPLCIHFEPEIFGDYFVVAKCGHIFHYHCIMKILNRGVTRCPLNCKIPMSPRKLTKLFGIDPNTSQGSARPTGRSNFTGTMANFSMPVSTYDYCFKIVLLGSSGVGKSCLMRRFSDNVFTENINATRGVDLVRKLVHIGGTAVQLIVWDTAGQETFRSIISTCVRDIQGILFVYDASSIQSLDSISSWVDFANDYGPKDTVRILVGNKADQTETKMVSDRHGKAVAESMGMSFIETSAKDSFNVEAAFRTLTGKILENEWILAGMKEKDKLRNCTIRLDTDSKPPEDSFCTGWLRRGFNATIDGFSHLRHYF